MYNVSQFVLNILVPFQELQADIQSGEQAFTSDEPNRSTPAVSVDTMLIGKPKR